MDLRSIKLPAEVPQDPFFPTEIPSGPAFLDTAACLCAYRDAPISHDIGPAWECIGNQIEQDTANSTIGKWFRPLHNTTTNPAQGAGLVWDASSPPNTKEPLVYDGDQDALVALNPTALDVHSEACTGRNHTTFSTAFYRAVREMETNETMISAMPCWRGPTAVPMQITTLEEWQQNGCNEGFLCENNTVNSLPQYCPPVQACQDARAAGLVCHIHGEQVGMGPFEPVVCQGGYYCPQGGFEKIRCPAGRYCQPGSTRPTRCHTVGSLCPAGSISELFYAPLIVLFVLDTVLILGILLRTLFKRAKRASSKRAAAADQAKGKSVDELSDRESCWTVPPGSPQSETLAGSQAASGVNGHRRNCPTEQSAPKNRCEVLTPQLATFVQSMRKVTQMTRFGLSFQYTNLSYHPKGASRPILHNVTGRITGGSVTAVMGGSGSGKTTFINVLMGKLTNTGGVVSVNDVPGKVAQYKKIIGYVAQDDIIFPELTVRENIYHSARIRLPRDWTDAEFQAHVDAVIDCLELSHIQDAIIGTTGKPLISGGQRKRVSIGMELAAAPLAMFLDEPTSGLDAAAASSIMRVLASIARLGISVIVTIHQPRAEIMGLLDDLILLANGQVVCQGPGTFVQEYFQTIGFSFPAYTNTGDVITDVITGNGQMYKTEGETSMEWLITHWACSKTKHSEAMPLTSSECCPEANQRKSTPLSIIRHLTVGALPVGRAKPGDSALLEASKKRGASYLVQTWLCLRRAMLQQWRNKTWLLFEMILASIAGFLIGLSQNSKNGVLFHGIYKGSFAMLSPAVDMTSAPQLSLLTGVAMGLISAAPGVRVLSEEILQHRREAEAGHSRLSYFLAKVLATLPRMFFACLHFSVLMLCVSRLAMPWGVAFAANLAYTWTIYGMASIVSTLVKREDAPLVATMVSLILGILCGAAPSLRQVGAWHLAWLWRISPGVWLTELYFGELVRPTEHLYQTGLAAESMGFSLDATARNLGVLLAMGTAYRLLSYAGLVFGKRLRI